MIWFKCKIVNHMSKSFTKVRRVWMMLWETLLFECNDVIFNGIHKMIAKRVQKIWLGRTMYNQKPLLQVFEEMTYENNLPVQIVGDKLHL